MRIYDLGRALHYNFDGGDSDKKLKFTLFEYTYSEIVLTSLLFFLFFLTLGFIVDFLFNIEILFVTFIFIGMIVASLIYIYPTKIYYLLKIVEYKKEMLNTIMRFSTYLSMKSNLEAAVLHSLEYTKGILYHQLRDILLKLERKEFRSLGEAFKDYSLIWNKYSPEFVDSLKLLEVASISSGKEAGEIMDEAISQIFLSYNIEQKRNSEELSSNIAKMISIGIMVPIMFLMLIPLVSVFIPKLINAGVLFFGFNIIAPALLLISALNFSAKRIQLTNIDIEVSDEHKPIPLKIFIFAFVVFLIFMIPAVIYLFNHSPSSITFESFDLETIFFVWLIPAGISVAIYIITSYYYFANIKLWKKFRAIEEDLPHLLNYFATYLNLSVPLENIFKEVTNDYSRHGFKNHPTVSILVKITFKLYHSKITLVNFVKNELPKLSAIKSFNESIEQVVSFSEFSLAHAAKVSKKIRKQRVDMLKLNDYILTLLNSSISLVGATISMLAPLLSALSIIMSFFIVTFIKFLSKQLEAIANLGSGATKVTINLIRIEDIVSPIYLELIIGFYIIQIILILSFLKTSIQEGYNFFSIMKVIKESQFGFLVFTICLFGGYFVFKTMFAGAMGVNLG